MPPFGGGGFDEDYFSGLGLDPTYYKTTQKKSGNGVKKGAESMVYDPVGFDYKSPKKEKKKAEPKKCLKDAKVKNIK